MCNTYIKDLLRKYPDLLVSQPTEYGFDFSLKTYTRH